MPIVGIFRTQLFKPSEIFIKSQGESLTRYEALYLGRRIFGDAGQSTAVTFATLPHWKALLAQTWFSLTRDPSYFAKALRSSRVALIHAHFAIDAVMSLRLARSLNVPLIATLHGMDVTKSDREFLLSARPNLLNFLIFRRQLLKSATHFVCVSDFIRRTSIERGFPQEKMTVIYTGIDCVRLKFRKGTGERGLIVHIARLVEKKGTMYLLHAMARLKNKGLNARLVIIGDGPMRTTLERLAEHLGIAGATSFLGVQSNDIALGWVAKARALALPSVTAANGDQEGFGMVTIEAGAQGVPAVGFASGGIVEAVVDGQTGLLCAERDVDGLAENIRRLIVDDQLCMAMGIAARKRVEEQFDIRKQTAKLEHLYDQVLLQEGVKLN